MQQSALFDPEEKYFTYYHDFLFFAFKSLTLPVNGYEGSLP